MSNVYFLFKYERIPTIIQFIDIKYMKMRFFDLKSYRISKHNILIFPPTISFRKKILRPEFSSNFPNQQCVVMVFSLMFLSRMAESHLGVFPLTHYESSLRKCNDGKGGEGGSQPAPSCGRPSSPAAIDVEAAQFGGRLRASDQLTALTWHQGRFWCHMTYTTDFEKETKQFCAKY